MTENDINKYVRSIQTNEAAELGWGRLNWLIGSAQTPGAEQTLGVCTIYPGKRNPLHSHPNCEELLYVVSGECDHRLGDETIHLTAGSVIRIPKGVPHWAKNTGTENVVAVISFSSPDRKSDVHEGDGTA